MNFEKCCMKMWKKCRYQRRHKLLQTRHPICADWILNKNGYQDLLRNVITTACKKANKNIWTKTNKESVKFGKQADILDKIEMNGTCNSFSTLKNHKENFTNHPTTRLINSSKNKIGWISKQLDQINMKLLN